MTGREREPPRNPNREPTPRRPTATRANPPKILNKPTANSHRGDRNFQGVCAQLSSHRLASVVIASPYLTQPHPPSPPPRADSVPTKSKVREIERTRETERSPEEKEERKKKIIILNSKIEYRKLKVKTCKSCFHFRWIQYQLYSKNPQIQKLSAVTKQFFSVRAHHFLDSNTEKCVWIKKPNMLSLYRAHWINGCLLSTVYARDPPRQHICPRRIQL